MIAGPYTGAIVGLSMSLPALAAGEYGAPFFAVGCGFAGGGLREACPKEDIWSFSPFVIFSLPRYVWRMLRDMHVNWQVMLLLAPVGLEFDSPDGRRALSACACSTSRARRRG